MSNSIARAFGVLRLLRQSSGSHSLTEIARALSLPPSSAHAVLTTLVDERAVTIGSDKRYQLGPAVFYLGASFSRSSPVHRAAWDDLIRIANRHGLNALIAIVDGHNHLILDVHQNTQPKIGAGGRLPLDAGSLGKAYFAWSGTPLPAELPAYTPASETDPAAFRRELVTIRRQGYATDKGEFVPGMGSVSTAVTSESGYEGLASLIAPLEALEAIGFDVVGGDLVTLAARASRILGDLSREPLFGYEPTEAEEPLDVETLP